MPPLAANIASRFSVFELRDALSLPGLLSLSRVGLALLFPCVTHVPWLALAVIGAAGVSDVLDGYFARKRGGGTPTGAALDPLTDKVFALSVMLSLVLRGELSLVFATLMSLRELLEVPLVLWLLLIPHARAVRAAHLKANVLGKLTTLLQFGALVTVLLALPRVELWLLATAVFGVLAALMYWLSFMRALTVTKGDVA
jgi:cardiolipin synthase